MLVASCFFLICKAFISLNFSGVGPFPLGDAIDGTLLEGAIEGVVDLYNEEMWVLCAARDVGMGGMGSGRSEDVKPKYALFDDLWDMGRSSEDDGGRLEILTDCGTLATGRLLAPGPEVVGLDSDSTWGRGPSFFFLYVKG